MAKFSETKCKRASKNARPSTALVGTATSHNANRHTNGVLRLADSPCHRVNTNIPQKSRDVNKKHYRACASCLGNADGIERCVGCDESRPHYKTMPPEAMPLREAPLYGY